MKRILTFSLLLIRMLRAGKIKLTVGKAFSRESRGRFRRTATLALRLSARTSPTATGCT